MADRILSWMTPPPTFVSAVLINEERALIRARPHFVAQAPDLPFNLLSDRQFEILSYELLRQERQDSVRAYDDEVLMPYGADKGRDVVLYSNKRAMGVVGRVPNPDDMLPHFSRLRCSVTSVRPNPRRTLLPQAQAPVRVRHPDLAARHGDHPAVRSLKPDGAGRDRHHPAVRAL
jgi:hypothetical protein